MAADWSIPSRLRIQTIDALNASLARRLPVLAGTGSALEPTDDPAPLYEAAGRRLIERLGDGSSVAAQLEVLIVHLGNRVDRLIELLSDLLAKRDQWLHPVVRARASEDLRATLEGTLQRVVQRHLTLLCDELGARALPGTFRACCSFPAGNLLSRRQPRRGAARAAGDVPVAQSAPPDGNSESLDTWRAIAAMLFKKNARASSTRP